MLRKILSISGKQGLFKLISSNKKLNVVESLLDGKRVPFYVNEKVISLNDVSIYTTESDIPLREVFKLIKEKNNNKKIELGAKASNKDLFEFFSEILPEYDKDKVYASDIKKLINWYNLLIDSNLDFMAVDDEENSGVEENKSEEAETVENTDKKD